MAKIPEHAHSPRIIGAITSDRQAQGNTGRALTRATKLMRIFLRENASERWSSRLLLLLRCRRHRRLAVRSTTTSFHLRAESESRSMSTICGVDLTCRSRTVTDGPLCHYPCRKVEFYSEAWRGGLLLFFNFPYLPGWLISDHLSADFSQW